MKIKNSWARIGIPHFDSAEICVLIILFSHLCGASLVAQLVKNLPVMQETWVQSLCWEDPLQKGLETHFGILAWRIPWTEEPGMLQSLMSQRVGYD